MRCIETGHSIPDRLRAEVMVAAALNEDPLLAELDLALKESHEPLPALGVVVESTLQSDFPRVGMAYSTTNAGEGIQPASLSTDHDLHDPARFARGYHERSDTEYGLTLSTGFTKVVRFDPWPEGDASSRDGSWRSSGVDGDSLFTRWLERPVLRDTPPSPMMMGDAHARLAADRAAQAMDRARYLPRAIMKREDYKQHFVAVGPEAVQSALVGLRGNINSSRLPAMFLDMLRSVTQELDDVSAVV